MQHDAGHTFSLTCQHFRDRGGENSNCACTIVYRDSWDNNYYNFSKLESAEAATVFSGSPAKRELDATCLSDWVLTHPSCHSQRAMYSYKEHSRCERVLKALRTDEGASTLDCPFC